MPRAWYSNEKVLVNLKRLAIFIACVVAYLLLRQIPIVAGADAWTRHQLVRLGTSFGGAVARLVASEESLATRLAVCEERRATLTTDNAELQALEREVYELRGLLSFTQRANRDGTAARILARSVGGTTTVTVDQGTRQGVTEGMAAVIGDGLLYGTVTTVGESTSVVRLTTDRASAIPAAILGERRTIGLVHGKEGALLVMEFVPQDADIAVDDVVVTSGLDGHMPEGLIIGTVSDIVAQESAPFKQAIIEPLHDPREWSTMFLLPSTAGL